MNTNQTDRVSFSYGFKKPGEEQYSSVNLAMSYSTDVLAGETAEEAMKRCQKFVLERLELETGPAPELVTFDPNNPEHRREADAHFDALRLTASRRRWLGENFLPGTPLSKVGAAIKDEVERYNREQTEKRRIDPFRVRSRATNGRSNWNGQRHS